MSTLTHRTTVYLDPGLHKALRIKAFDSSCSISELINEAIRHELQEDAEDLAAFDERDHEQLISFEKLIKDLKSSGKI